MAETKKEKKRSFLERIAPGIPRSRLIAWPGAAEDASQKVRVRVLADAEIEAAFFETQEHFRRIKRAARPGEAAFTVRERLETVFLAYRDPETDEPIAETADDLSKLVTGDLRDELYAAWLSIQREFSIRPTSAEEIEELIEALKKNIPEEVLLGLPSTLLVRLLRIMGSRLAGLTADASSGSPQ